jgi:sec-independent protein translocase protein TatB
MFDIAWSELGVIAVVAVVLLRPEDLPILLRTVKKTLSTLQQWKLQLTHTAHEIMEEAEMEPLKKEWESLKEIKHEFDQPTGYITDLDGNLQPTYDLSDLQPNVKAQPLPSPTAKPKAVNIDPSCPPAP